MRTKACSKCGKEKALKDFAKNATRKDGLQPYCRECHSEFTKQNYRENKKAYVDRAMAKKKEMISLINSLKDKPCADCEKTYPPWVMDFDHKYGKEICVSNLRNHGSTKRILAETKKCDVVCSNCHRERTHQRLALLA